MTLGVSSNSFVRIKLLIAAEPKKWIASGKSRLEVPAAVKSG